jgi:beta-galactosidase
VAAAEPSYELTAWRVAPAQADKPDALVKMSTADMNTWAAVKPGNLQRTPKGQWALYRANFTPWAGIIARGGVIQLQKLNGTAEVWLDGVKVGEKTDAKPGELTVVLPAKKGERELTLLVQSASGTTGLGGSVRVEVAR